MFACLDENPKLFVNKEKILKIFDENSIGKLDFLFFIFLFSFFRKFVAKNRAFVNNTIFLREFFSLWGGGISTFPPPGNALAWDPQAAVQIRHFSRLTVQIGSQSPLPASSAPTYLCTAPKFVSQGQFEEAQSRTQ